MVKVHSNEPLPKRPNWPLWYFLLRQSIGLEHQGQKARLSRKICNVLHILIKRIHTNMLFLEHIFLLNDLKNMKPLQKKARQIAQSAGFKQPLIKSAKLEESLTCKIF